MGDNKGIILVLIGIFVLFGLSYGPMKEAAKRNSENRSTTRQTPSQSSGASSISTDYAVSKQAVADEIKQAERDILAIEKALQKKIEESQRSPYYGKVRVSKISNRNDPDPNQEYVRIFTNLGDGQSVNITGWYFKSEITKNFVVIGKASLLPFPFTRNDSDVILERGDEAIITKGFSPVGISFRTNICTGYFEENRDFYPRLAKQCPEPKEENLPLFSSMQERNDECIEIIDRIRRCTTPSNEFLRDLPDSVTRSCKNYLRTHFNYNACVAENFSKTNFPGNEYRVFLNKFGTLWLNRSDKINLHDRNGLIVDSISY